MQFGARSVRPRALPRRRSVTIGVFVHRANDRTNANALNENLPFKSHFGATYFLSWRWRWRERRAGAGAGAGRGSQGFIPFGKRKHPLPSHIHFVQRYGLNLCGSFPPFSLTPSLDRKGSGAGSRTEGNRNDNSPTHQLRLL